MRRTGMMTSGRPPLEFWRLSQQTFITQQVSVAASSGPGWDKELEDLQNQCLSGLGCRL